MAVIKLNKDVTIAWRDGKNYRINNGVDCVVPNALVDYVITAHSYIGSVVAFKKDEEFVPTPVVKLPVVNEIKEPTVIEITDSEVVTTPEIFTTKEELVNEEEQDKKQLDILSQLMEKSKTKGATAPKAKTTGKSKASKK